MSQNIVMEMKIGNKISQKKGGVVVGRQVAPPGLGFSTDGSCTCSCLRGCQNASSNLLNVGWFYTWSEMG